MPVVVGSMLVLILQPPEDASRLKMILIGPQWICVLASVASICALGTKLEPNLTKVIDLPGKVNQENFSAAASLTKAISRLSYA